MSRRESLLQGGSMRASPPFSMDCDDSPLSVKRRRLSGSVSPPPATRGRLSPPMSLATLLGDVSIGDISSCSMDCSTTEDSSASLSVATPGSRKRYRKDELWAAIRSDYHYLMDDEIIETCKVGPAIHDLLHLYLYPTPMSGRYMLKGQ